MLESASPSYQPSPIIPLTNRYLSRIADTSAGTGKGIFLVTGQPQTRQRVGSRRQAGMALLGGVWPPVVALLSLSVLVAGCTALAFSRVAGTGVPRPVIDSQQYIAEDGAAALRAALDERVSGLREAADGFGAGAVIPPARLLDTLAARQPRWRGTAVLDLATGHTLAARGERVPLGKGDAGRLSMPSGLVIVDDGSAESRLLVFAGLSKAGGRRALVASSDLQLPDIGPGMDRTLQVADRTGRIVAATGANLRKSEIRRIAAAALDEVAEQRSPSRTGRSGAFEKRAGSLLGVAHGNVRTAAGFAAIAPRPGARRSSPSGELGLIVITTAKVPSQESVATGDHRFGFKAAAVVVLLVIFVVSVLRTLLHKPLRRLSTEARRVAEGHEPARPVAIPRFGEPARIGAALEALRTQLNTGPVSERRRGVGRIGLRTVLVLCAAILTAGSAPVLLHEHHKPSDTAALEQLSEDQRQRTKAAANRIRRSLNKGYTDISRIASVTRADPPETTRRALNAELGQSNRFQSLYVVDSSGAIIAAAGDRARTPKAARIEHGIAQTNRSGTQPVIAAVVPQSPGPHTRHVVGEYRIQTLNSLVTRPHLGSAWLIDEQRRIIASNRGFLAFSRLPDGHLSTAVDGVHGATTTTAGLLLGADAPAIGAVTPATHEAGPTRALKWQVATVRPALWLDLPQYATQRRAILIGLLGSSSVVICLGWLHIVAVRPLRELADRVEGMAAGDCTTVLFPRYQDEVGTIVLSLEMVRQMLPASTAHRHSPDLGG